MKECLRAGHLDGIALADAASRYGLGLHQAGMLHCDEEALLWRCVCIWLAEDAAARGLVAANTGGAAASVEAAAAGQRLDALERLLPATADDILALVATHVRAQQPLFFSAGCLIDVVLSCVDFADGQARSAALEACAELIGYSGARCALSRGVMGSEVFFKVKCFIFWIL